MRLKGATAGISFEIFSLPTEGFRMKGLGFSVWDRGLGHKRFRNVRKNKS